MMGKLSAMTGMRQGELIALKRKYVHEYYIEVAHSWEAGIGLKDPKTKKSKRPVLITVLWLRIKREATLFCYFIYIACGPKIPARR